MKYRKWKKVLAFALALVMLFGATGLTSQADTISDLQKSIQEKQNAISNAQKEKKALQSGMTDVKKVISSLENSKNNLAAYISELDVTLSKAQEKIQELKGQIAQKEEDFLHEVNPYISTNCSTKKWSFSRYQFLYPSYHCHVSYAV